jgi:hypothetical protein
MTCFVRTGIPLSNNGNNSSSFIIMIIPLLTILISIVVIIIFKRRKGIFKHDEKVATIYKSYIHYMILYICLNIPLIFMIILSIFKGDTSYSNSFIKALASITTLICSLIPFIMSVFRVVSNIVRIKWVYLYFKKRRLHKKILISQSDLPLMAEQSLMVSVTKEDAFDQIERMIMINSIRDILIGIAYSLKQSEKTSILSSLSTTSSEYAKHKIDYESFKQELNDDSVYSHSFLEFSFIDYLPQTFQKLRTIQHLNVSEMIESFLPKNNQLSIDKSAGKSGAFFIPTADNNFIIKSLKYEECELIRQKFLDKYLAFMEQNPKSMLCPIYGMYKMISFNGNETLLIVMRNLLGNFKDNIMCKYDLKGSTYKREDGLNVEKVESQVMKDIDFDNIEKVLMIPSYTISTFKEITQKDSAFLCEQELMDYSLFVVKISIDKKTAHELFGKSFEEDRTKAFEEMISQSNLNSSVEIDVTTNNEKFKHYRRFIFPSLKEGTAYIIAIIDFFQYYNFFKYMETKYKKIVFTRTKSSYSDFNTSLDMNGTVDISCVNPKKYRKRFDLMIEKITRVKEILTES